MSKKEGKAYDEIAKAVDVIFCTTVRTPSQHDINGYATVLQSSEKVPIVVNAMQDRENRPDA